jgi:hypothetical protein
MIGLSPTAGSVTTMPSDTAWIARSRSRSTASAARRTRDVADVALDHACAVDEVHVAHELDGDLAAIAGLERQVLVAHEVVALKLGERLLGRGDVLEHAEVPEVPADQLAVRVAGELGQERVDVIDPPGRGVDDEDAVLGRFEQPSISELAGCERLLRQRGVAERVRVHVDLHHIPLGRVRRTSASVRVRSPCVPICSCWMRRYPEQRVRGVCANASVIGARTFKPCAERRARRTGGGVAGRGA